MGLQEIEHTRKRPDSKRLASGSKDESDGDEHALEVTVAPNVSSRRRRRMSVQVSKLPTNLHSSSCFLHKILEPCHAAMENKQDAVSNPPSERESSHEEIQLFNKRQLNDMALGIRELSMQLGHVQLITKIRRILIVTKAHDDELVSMTRNVVKWLLSSEQPHQFVVFVDAKLENNKDFSPDDLQGSKCDGEGPLRYWTPELCAQHPHMFDFVVTLGGDGTVLYTSWLFQRVVPPVLSFALGSLGFLTKFDFADHQSTLSKAFKEGITVSLRMRFECTIMTAKRTGGSEDDERNLEDEILHPESETHDFKQTICVLNDIVVDRGPNATMTSTELYGDQEHITSIMADGLCIATPTGSTAYSLAAGGSLCHPEIPGMLISPICAHTLSFRPLIVPDSMTLRLAVPYTSRTSAWCSFDGKCRIELKQGDFVTIRASRFPFPTVHSTGSDWFTSITRTLDWNQRKGQKPFSKDRGQGK